MIGFRNGIGFSFGGRAALQPLEIDMVAAQGEEELDELALMAERMIPESRDEEPEPEPEPEPVASRTDSQRTLADMMDDLF